MCACACKRGGVSSMGISVPCRNVHNRPLWDCCVVLSVLALWVNVRVDLSLLAHSLVLSYTPKSPNSSFPLWNSDFEHWWVEFFYLESKIFSSENIFLWHNKSTTQHTLWQVYSLCFQSRQHCVSCVDWESFEAEMGQKNFKFWPDLDLWWIF